MRARTLLAVLLLWLAAGPALAALSLDGTPNTSTNTGTSATLALTLTNANDVVVLYAINTSGTTTALTVADSCGNSWTKRRGVAWNGGVGDAEEWYTVSAAAYNCTITATYGASTSWRLLAFGVTGANLTTPFDVNASLPKSNNLATGTALPPSAAFSTTANSTMLITVLRTQGAAGTIYNPSGFTTLLNAGTAMQAAYSIVASPQTSVSPTWNWTTGGQNSVGLWDAVQMAAAPTPGSVDTSIFQGIP